MFKSIIKPLIVLPFLLSACSGTNKQTNCNKRYIEPIYPELSDEELLERCDLFYRISFVQIIGEVCNDNDECNLVYFTEYEITIHEKFKGEKDLNAILVLKNKQPASVESLKTTIETNTIYDAYISYYEPLDSYRLFDYPTALRNVD